jgi:hypothetical protein
VPLFPSDSLAILDGIRARHYRNAPAVWLLHAKSPKIAQELSKPLAIDFTTIERRPKTGIHMGSRRRLHLLLWIVAVILLDASGACGSTGSVGGVAPSSGAGGTPAAGQPQSSPPGATAQVPAPANPNNAGATNRGGCISGTITNNSGTSTGTAPIVGTQRGQGAANDASNSITGTGSNTSAGSKPGRWEQTVPIRQPLPTR